MVRRLKVRLAAAEARIVELSKNDDIMHIERSVGGRYLTPQGAVAIALRRNLGNCACAFRDETLDSQYVQYSPCISLHDMHLHYLLFMVAPNDVESTLNHVERRCYMLDELLVVTPQPLVEPVSLQPRWTSLVVWCQGADLGMVLLDDVSKWTVARAEVKTSAALTASYRLRIMVK
jgi:hypothetical protein